MSGLSYAEWIGRGDLAVARMVSVLFLLPIFAIALVGMWRFVCGGQLFEGSISMSKGVGFARTSPGLMLLGTSFVGILSAVVTHGWVILSVSVAWMRGFDESPLHLLIMLGSVLAAWTASILWHGELVKPQYYDSPRERAAFWGLLASEVVLALTFF